MLRNDITDVLEETFSIAVEEFGATKVIGTSIKRFVVGKAGSHENGRQLTQPNLVSQNSSKGGLKLK